MGVHPNMGVESGGWLGWRRGRLAKEQERAQQVTNHRVWVHRCTVKKNARESLPLVTSNAIQPLGLGPALDLGSTLDGCQMQPLECICVATSQPPSQGHNQ